MGNDRQSPSNRVTEAASGTESAREQVDRILASDTLHNSEVLRKLLRFLADKTFAGEADDLKEYSIGLDALGKPSTYDPRQDAGVRIQASRLRQKLDDYYRDEGSNDPLVIDLPRGRFKLGWRPNGEVAPVAAVPQAPPLAENPAPAAPPHELHSLKRWRRLAIALAGVSLLLAIVALWSFTAALRARGAAPESTPELDALWRPFLSSSRHLIVAFANPLFVRFQRDGAPDVVYHKIGNNSWEEVLHSPEFATLSRSLGNPPAKPSFNMVERSQLVSAFVLEQFLALRRRDVSLARSAELSWQQLADNDVIQFAPLNIDEEHSALPVRPAMIVDGAGVRNLQPTAGEPAVYPDPPDHQPGDGEGLELVSVLPGPMGRTTVVTFSSNHAWGVLGGIQALTDPAFVHGLVNKLREASGAMPAYYQIVLRIRYRDGTPTSASYVMHRVLAVTQSPQTRAEH